MNFAIGKGPFLRNRRTTTSIMLELFAVLFVIFGVSVAFYATKYNLMAGIRVLSIGLISIFTTLVIDVVVALIKGKRKIKDIAKFVLKSYSYVTALIFALCLPAGTSFYVVIVGSIIATVIGKYVFGGFGNNIFNPAIIGRIFVGLCFPDKLQTIKVLENNSIDLVSGSTLTGSIDWNTGVSSFAESDKVSLLQTLFGEYQGAIGETFTILLIVAAIYLIVRGIINYRLTIGYLLTAVLCSIGIGFVEGVNLANIGSYILTTMATGGLMFAAVFMITDPVTSPKSQDGKIIYASVAGFLAIFIRVFSSYPEGVMFSIALANMITPLIDSSIKGNTFENLTKRYLKIACVLVICLGVMTGYAALDKNQESASLLENDTTLLNYGGDVNE
jgi:electron transport complex protein RnfD